jgi:hypothetical protein
LFEKLLSVATSNVYVLAPPVLTAFAVDRVTGWSVYRIAAFGAGEIPFGATTDAGPDGWVVLLWQAAVAARAAPIQRHTAIRLFIVAFP